MVRLRLALGHRVPLVLLSLALVAATSFFLGAMWDAYQSTNPNASANVTASAFASPATYHSGITRISTITRSGDTLLCTQADAKDHCDDPNASVPMSVTTGEDGETYFPVVDPKRPDGHVTFDVGGQQFDAGGDDDGPSVSASLSETPNSVTSDGQDAQSLQSQSRQ